MKIPLEQKGHRGCKEGSRQPTARKRSRTTVSPAVRAAAVSSSAPAPLCSSAPGLFRRCFVVKHVLKWTLTQRNSS